MKFSKLDLLTLLISLFLFSSCKDSSTIGLDIDPANAVQGTLIDTVTVTSRTVADVPASTYSTGSGIGRYPLGEMRDDVFGATTASLAMSVNLPNGSIIFGTNPVIDSVVLVLPFYQSPAGVTQYRGVEFYGDSTAIYSVNVSQLTDNLSTQSTWLSNKIYTSSTQLGTFAAKISPNTPVKVVDIVTGAKDTVKTNLPQMRIKLDPAFIKSKILSLDSLSLSSNAKFNLAFKGLKVTASASGKSGGMMFLDFTANSNVEIYYKQQNATTPANIDTLVALFPINPTTNAVAATVAHDYTNTPVADQLKTGKEYQTTYLQSMSGVRNKITFPYLKTLIAKIGSKVVINKAELVIDSSNPADSIPFKIAPRIALYTTDIAQQRVNVQDNNPYSSTNTTGDIRTATSGIPFGGFYDYTKKSYTFVITNFIQDLVDGKTADNGTYLGSTGFSGSMSLFPFANTAGRVVIGSFNNTNNRKIRLNIYYVKTNTK